MLNIKDKRLLCFLIIIAIWLFHVINNAVIITNYPSTWTTLGETIREKIDILDTYNIVGQIINSNETFLEKCQRLLGLLNVPSPRPRMATFISAFAYLIFGEKYSIHIINGLYYLLLILSTYFVGKKLYSMEIGLLSAYIVSLYIDIFIFSRAIKNIDLLLTAIFIFIFCLLLCTKNFSKAIYSIFFGIFLGIGILVKGSIIIFLLSPFLFYSYYAFKDFRVCSYKTYRSILNLFFAILIAILISSLWWRGIPSVLFSKFLLYIKPHKIEVFIANPMLVSEQPYGFFSRVLYNITSFFELITITSSKFLFFIFICAFYLFLRMKKKNFILVFSFIIPLIILSFSALKLGRYYMPILPFMAIITSAGLFEITNKVRRRIIVALVCVIAVVQFFRTSYGIPEYKFGEFYNKVYAEYNNVSEKFVNAIYTRNKNMPCVAFVSEASSKTHDLFMTLKYLMMKSGLQNSNFGGVENLDRCDFMVLLLDRRYFLKITSLLDAGGKHLKINPYRFLFENRYNIDRFYEIFLNPKRFYACIINMKQLFLNKSERTYPLEIFEKLLVLEAIKRKMLNIELIRKQKNGIFNDISLWSDIYNERGIEGLIQDLTLSPEEFKSWLETGTLNKPILKDGRWMWLYKKIKDYKFFIVEHADIPSLSIDFYLLQRNKY